MLNSMDVLYTINQPDEIIKLGYGIIPIGNIIETWHSIIDTVSGIKETVKAIKGIANYIVGTILLCSPDVSFTGAGGKNILNDNKPFLGPGGKNILDETPALETRTKLDQTTKERQNNEILISLKIAKILGFNSQLLREGQHTGKILYEEVDRDSSTILALSNPHPNNRAIGLFGVPRYRRTGLHLDTLSPQGTYVGPVVESWLVDNVWRNGVVCPALRQPGIKFIDNNGVDIPYNGNKMLVSYNNTRN